MINRSSSKTDSPVSFVCKKKTKNKFHVLLLIITHSEQLSHTLQGLLLHRHS